MKNLKGNIFRYCRISPHKAYLYDCENCVEYELNKIASDIFEALINKSDNLYSVAEIPKFFVEKGFYNA